MHSTSQTTILLRT